MNWRRTPQLREQRASSPLEVTSYAQRLQLAAKTLIEYFTPRSAEAIKEGHHRRARRAWRARRSANGAERKRRRVRLIARAARRVRARRHAKSGRAA